MSWKKKWWLLLGIIGHAYFFCQLMLLGIILWGLMFLLSYLWVKMPIVLMLETSLPWLSEIKDVLEWVVVNRNYLSLVWAILLLSLFWWQLYFSGRVKNISLRKLWLVLSLVVFLASISYSYVSDDVFSYLFAGRTIFYHGENPYLVMPSEYLGSDLWVNFMSNIDNVYFNFLGVGVTYIYGPVFLGFSLIPFLWWGPVLFFKLFWSFKLLMGLVFVLSGVLLLKINKDDVWVWVYWFFNPFLIFEFLVNGHNDLLMIFLWFLAYFLWLKRKFFGSLLVWFLSVGTKYVSGLMLVIFLIKDEVKRRLVFRILGIVLFLLILFFLKRNWYYIWLYMVLPFVGLKRRSWLFIFAFHLISTLSYFSFLYFNAWGRDSLFSFWWGLLFLALVVWSEKSRLI